ncbi:MAG: outer membrane protein assembly factor BamB family protein [Candidatus Odinarchaeia archaeon]
MDLLEAAPVILVTDINYFHLYGLSADNGSLIWSYPLNYEVRGKPAVSEDMLFIVQNDEVWAFDFDGHLRWIYDVNEHINMLKCVGERLFIFAYGVMTVLNASSGNLIWQKKVSTAVSASDSDYIWPVFEDQYFYSYNGTNLIKVNYLDGAILDGVNLNFNINGETKIVNSSVLYTLQENLGVLAVNTSDGSKLWFYPEYQGGNLFDYGYVWQHIAFENNILLVSGYGGLVDETGGGISYQQHGFLLIFENSQEWWSDEFSRSVYKIEQNSSSTSNGWMEINLYWSNAPIRILTNSSVFGVNFQPSEGKFTMEVAGIYGTTGVLKVIAPKEFVINSSNIEIYLDNVKIEINFTIQGQHSIAEVNYTHSSHPLRIELPIIIGEEPKLFRFSPNPSQDNFLMLTLIVLGTCTIAAVGVTLYITKIKNKLN